jgi:hypothetical protein
MATYLHTFTSGDTLTPTKLNAARTATDIVNADIKSDAAIAGTKIAPDFGSQNIATSGIGQIGRPSDYWGDTFFGVGASSTLLGQLDTAGAFEVTLTSNGYRDNSTPSNLWVSHGANSLSGAAQVGLNPNGVIVFRTESGKTTGSTAGITERMRISAAGTVSIGTTAALSVASGSDDGMSIGGNGTASISRDNNPPLFLRRRSGNGSIAGFYRDTTNVGTISVTTTATAYNTSSDYRLKQNVEPMVGGLAKLSALAPKTFEFINDPNVKVDGFIAHEVQAVVPIAVTGEKDGEEMQGLDHSKLVPVLVAALQELSAKVAALEAA